MLRIDPKSDQIELVGDSFPGRWKWYGGILAGDGCIYGIPYCAASVLKIDPATGHHFGTCGSVFYFTSETPWPNSVKSTTVQSGFRVFPLPGQVSTIGELPDGRWKLVHICQKGLKH